MVQKRVWEVKGDSDGASLVGYPVVDVKFDLFTLVEDITCRPLQKKLITPTYATPNAAIEAFVVAERKKIAELKNEIARREKIIGEVLSRIDNVSAEDLENFEWVLPVGRGD